MIVDYGLENNLNLKTLIVIGRMVKSIDAVLSPNIAETGLTQGQFGVLEALYHKGELTVNQVLDKTLSTSGNITVIIDNLIKMGLVEKKVSPKDKRSRLLNATENGKRVIHDFFPSHLEVLNKAMSGLNDEEQVQLIHLAKKLGTSIGVEQ